MIALVDGDLIVYRSGWASENTSEDIACFRANTTLEDIISATKADSFIVFLSDSLKNNYRFKLDPAYKANRLNQPKPKHYAAIQSFLKERWSAEVTVEEEADDALGIAQYRSHKYSLLLSPPIVHYDFSIPHSVICSIDKDLLQIPGKHYNFVKKEWFTQDLIGGLRHFYSQLLIGDIVDNIDGIKGIGKITAGRLLNPCQTETELFQKVQYQYKDDERLLRNGRLLWIRREPKQLWKFPSQENIIQDESGEFSDALDDDSLRD